MSDFIRAWPAPRDPKSKDKPTLYESRNGDITIRSGGDVNWRNNNPGSMKSTFYSNKHGAIGQGYLNVEIDKKTGKKIQTHFAVFPSREIGNKAQSDLLDSSNYKNMTLKKAIYRYTPKELGNNPDEYLRDIKVKLKIDSDVNTNNITPQQMAQIKTIVKKHESNMTPGKEVTYPAGSPEAIKLKATQTIDPNWARAQPSGTLNQDDIHALMRTKDYTKDGRVHDLVRQWYQEHYGPDQPATDATGRVIDTPHYVPVPQEKPTQDDAPPDDQGDADGSDGEDDSGGDTGNEDDSGEPGQQGSNDSDDGYDPDIFGDNQTPELGGKMHISSSETGHMFSWDDEAPEYGEDGAVLVRAYNRNAPKSGSNVQVQSYSRNRPGKRRI